mmetsp:Transcript_31303/g.43393  ORF Transcript_31303/g.43393 Transcript_31303/m.43393 type:complete len:225 (+) Transcript_31303:128-802(+)
MIMACSPSLCRLGSQLSVKHITRNGRAQRNGIVPSNTAVCYIKNRIACKYNGSSNHETRMNSRRSTLFVTIGTTLFGAPLGAWAAERNDAIMKSLKNLDRRNEVESGEVVYRLRKAQGQLQRAVSLAKIREYTRARELLRGGDVDTIRDDLKNLEAYLVKERPTFSTFEELALIGSLEAFDNILRAIQRGGNANATQENVDADGVMLLQAMDDVVSLLDRKYGS